MPLGHRGTGRFQALAALGDDFSDWQRIKRGARLGQTPDTMPLTVTLYAKANVPLLQTVTAHNTPTPSLLSE
jgi:hypothetical protein